MVRGEFRAGPLPRYPLACTNRASCRKRFDGSAERVRSFGPAVMRGLSPQAGRVAQVAPRSGVTFRRVALSVWVTR